MAKTITITIDEQAKGRAIECAFHNVSPADIKAGIEGLILSFTDTVYASASNEGVEGEKSDCLAFVVSDIMPDVMMQFAMRETGMNPDSDESKEQADFEALMEVLSARR
jgi:hypothetical protein